MRFGCNFLGKNCVSAYIYAFCMFDLPHHINVAQGGHKSNLVQYQSIPTWYLYIFLSKRHFQLIIWYQYFQGLWYFQDIWPLYAGDLSHGAPLARVQPAHLWEVPPQVERDHPVTRLTMTSWTGWRCWRSEQELLRNLLKSKETTLWLQKQKTLMPSIR